MSQVSEKPPQIFEATYYQRLYEIEERHWWSIGMRDVMDALLSGSLAGRKALRVLDIGCGTGYLFDYLKKRYSVEGEVVGIDLSPHALEFCQMRGASALALADAGRLPFAASSFDLIICIDTLQHLSPAGADRVALAEFRRVLRPNGVLYLRTNSALGHVSLSGADPDLYRRYDLATVKGLLTSAGMQVERATYVNMLPGVWGMLLERIRGRETRTKPIGPGLAIGWYPRRLGWVSRAMRVVMRLEAWLIGALHLSLPFGHSSAFVARRGAANG